MKCVHCLRQTERINRARDEWRNVNLDIIFFVPVVFCCSFPGFVIFPSLHFQMERLIYISSFSAKASSRLADLVRWCNLAPSWSSPLKLVLILRHIFTSRQLVSNYCSNPNYTTVKSGKEYLRFWCFYTCAENLELLFLS